MTQHTLDSGVDPLRFGVFLSPIHDSRRDPTNSLEGDLDLVSHLDRLGFDEVWVGEHHSTGWEIVGSPELFLAAAAQRTSRIKLATGVVSLPYHNPFHVAERIVLLDHLSHGRAILGVGPGALPQDSKSLGIDPMDARGYLMQGIDVIQRLLNGESITEKAEWFHLNDARLQLFPHKGRELELVVTAAVSSGGPRIAGEYGTSMLSLAATQGPGTAVLARHWEIVEEQAQAHGKSVSRQNWRLVGPAFVAETRAEARRAVEAGIDRWTYYMTEVNTAPFSLLSSSDSTEYKIDKMIESGFAVIGTPEDAIAQIARLREVSGGFGTFLTWANDWASSAAMKRSYELMANEVFPAFQSQTAPLVRAEQRAQGTRQSDVALSYEAKTKATADYDRLREVQ